MTDSFDRLAGLHQMVVPDLWQQQAVTALRAGKDVVVQAPTGSGKTLVFELWSNNGRPHGQAIYTVPTRALANDKLAEWRARGWDVGIATGDLAENLDAPILVATLETQKSRLIRGEGPSLLVVDEFQMIGDPDRGLNYELALALSPPKTQLLLLSGSVANPQDVVKWLTRLGRDAVLVKHDHRPVPLEEVYVDHLNLHVPRDIRGYWPRFVAKALAEDLGPILLFAPRRQGAETLAADLARQLPTPDPLSLTGEQKALVGDHLSRMLKSRIAYHHSGLSYGARAGVIEPLAKAGQLRAVVATMGLAAGINFSLRSVALAGESYRRDYAEQPLRPDEILQMFGRAGRRGIDETGYVLVSANQITLRDGHPGQLARSGMVDWGALLGLMGIAADGGVDPFAEAVRVQERLFTSKPIFLGVEQSLKNPNKPCGLMTDAERARHVRRKVRELRNSRGEWEPFPKLSDVPLEEIRFLASEPVDPSLPRLLPILTRPAALQKIGTGTLVPVEDSPEGKRYGRELTVADRLESGNILIAKWIRKLTGWKARQASLTRWETKVEPLIRARLAHRGTPVIRFRRQSRRITAQLSLGHLRQKAPVDQHGIALWQPEIRDVLAHECVHCDWIDSCRKLSTSPGTAMLWRRLHLVHPDGSPTRRGRITSFFPQSYGLAIAAGLEDETIPLDELVYELANLDAGFRFAGDDSRWAGRIAMASQTRYGLQTIPGYLQDGLPPRYGAGADQIVGGAHRNPAQKQAWITGLVGAGDIDRLIIEWRSLLRQISHAPLLDWPRWTDLQTLARSILHETESPTLIDLPPLNYQQTKRLEHRLNLRRH